MSYVIYKHTSPSGKCYIGMTCQKPEYRWRDGKKYEHNEHFAAAIKKYGWSRFSHEILYADLTREEAVQREIETIALYKSDHREYGYNITPGGDHYKHTPESRAKISLASKGRRHSEETRRKMSDNRRGEKSYFYGKEPWIKGKHLSEQTKQKLREAHTGKTLSAEHRKKLSEAKKGKPAPNRKSIFCKETGRVYPSIMAAAEEVDVSFSNLAAACRPNGRQKTAGGYHWEYVKEKQA